MNGTVAIGPNSAPDGESDRTNQLTHVHSIAFHIQELIPGLCMGNLRGNGHDSRAPLGFLLFNGCVTSSF